MTASLFHLAVASKQAKGLLPLSLSFPKRKGSPLEKIISLMAFDLVVFPFEIAIGLIAIAIGFFFRHPTLVPSRLLYEVAIADLIVRDRLSKIFPFLKQPWWHPITEDIFLGGVPLVSRSHPQMLKDFGIGAICTVLEEEEAQRKTFISQPALPTDWEALDIPQRRFNCADMEAMDPTELRAAVEWVRRQIIERKRVYVHCKAGRGRSAVIIICYLIRYENMNIDEAIRYVAGKRKVVTLRPCQLDSIHRFATSV